MSSYSLAGPTPPSIDRNNNFDIIRLFAALQVAVLHASRHLDAGMPDELTRFLELFPGVPIFFFISGLLVTSSLAKRPLLAYAESRARRILPALVLAFVLAVVILTVFGQIGSTELIEPAFWAWAFGQVTLFQIFSPDMFRDFGVGVVNGSLWTIPVEVGFYVLLPVIAWVAAAMGPAATIRRRMTFLLVIGAIVSFAIYALVWPTGPDTPVVIKLISASPAAHLWQFALGALTYLYYDKAFAAARRLSVLPLGWAAPLVVYAVLGWWLEPRVPLAVFEGVGYPLLMFGVFSLAVAAPSAARLLRGYDISYGLYLYHMLAVNVGVALGFKGHWAAAPVAVTIAALTAAASWRLLESPILHRAGAKRPK